MNHFLAFLVVLLACCEPFVLFAADDPGVKSSTTGTENGLVPDREVHYIDSEEPQWKLTWDRARELSRQEKFAEALVQYELLFLQKENIAAARWEYVSILLHVERWQEAAASLALLLEVEPDKREFLLARALILLETGDIDQAAALYGQLYERKPESPDAVTALLGLITALEKQGKHDVLLPLLNQLMLRKPGDVDLQKKAAFHALSAGKTDLSLELLHKAMLHHPEDIEIVRLMALSYEKAQDIDKAVIFWQRILRDLPEDREAHLHLVSYYRMKANNTEEYFHLEQSLKFSPDDPELLTRIIDLSLLSGRADMALDYLAWYLSIRPGDTWGLSKKIQAERDFAKDLVELIENDGSRILWRDLVKVTSDRKGIYRAMADILREQKNERCLADVLLVLHEEDSGDESVLKELQSLLLDQGRIDELAGLKVLHKRNTQAQNVQ